MSEIKKYFHFKVKNVRAQDCLNPGDSQLLKKAKMLEKEARKVKFSTVINLIKVIYRDHVTRLLCSHCV
jgi:hypothetical protein